MDTRADIKRQALAAKIKRRIGAVQIAVANEREFQDKKWGTIDECGHSLAEWVMIAEAELNEAKMAVIKGGEGRNSLRSEIVQTLAVLHAALEQHGVEDEHNGRAL